MSWQVENGSPIHKEMHFDDRRVKCFEKRPLSVDHMLREAVARHGDGDAIVAGEVRISYSTLDLIVSRVASNLLALGVARGDRIALVLGNCPEFIYVVLAAARIAAIAVPVNVREQTPELAYILNNCGARVLIYDTGISMRLPLVEDITEVMHRFSVGGIAAGAPGFAELLATPLSPPTDCQVGEEDVAVILYTSGTTGRPKGAMLTHFNIVHSVMHFEMCMGLTKTDRSVLAVPASHVTGLIANILTMIRVAGCILILPQFEPATFLELAACESMTHTLIVPAMYNLCLLRVDFAGYNLTSWRIGGYGGAPMPETTIDALASKLPNLILVNAYGSTEVTSPATIMPIGGTSRQPDSVGWTVPCGDIQIIGSDGRTVAPGEVGEIWIAGPMVVPGYWDDPEKTSSSFSNGYWKSGDIGSKDEGGFVTIHDRIKDMIIRGGYNVYSTELENTLSHHPSVIESAAIARPDPVLGEKIHVFVRVSSNEVTANDMRQFCSERLAGYKVPDFVTFLDEPLPRNANGKIQKASLRALST